MTRELEIVNYGIVLADTELDLSRVPPAARRRLSPLQKVFFHLASHIETEPSENTVFASCCGETSLTHRLVEDFNAEGSVSPNRFSTSVYNAAPGLWSVATKNPAPYTAIAAAEDTLECGLLELLDSPARQMFIYAEEAPIGGGIGILFGKGGGRKVRLTTHARKVATEPLTFAALCDFLRGASTRIDARFMSLEGVPPCV